MAQYQTWSEKQAAARARWNEQRRMAAKKRQPRRVAGSVENDFFDMVSQMVGVTNEWTGAGKKKRKR